MKKIIFGLLTLVFVFTVVSCDLTSGSNTRTVKWMTDGAKNGDVTETKDLNSTIDALEVSKDGMTFGGWYVDIDLQEKATFPYKVEKNTTFYAKWVVTLSFDTQGGETIPSITQESGSFFTIPEVKARDGYVFVGWFTDKEYTTRLTYVMPKTNTTAYARWQVYEEGSAITLDNNWYDNDKVFMVSNDENGTKFVASSGKAEWSYVYLKINVNAKANTTVVVELQGTKDCPVVFKLEGGEADVTETSLVMTGEPQLLEWSVDPANLTATGNQMFMFFLNGGVVGCGETPEYIQIKSVSLYRTKEQGEPQKSAIYFVTNGGTPVETIYEAADTAVTRPEDPVKEGYIFKGWFTENTFVNEYTFTTMPAKGQMLYAKWEAEEVLLPDLDLMGEELTHSTVDAYTATSTKELISLKKNALAGEWDHVLIPMVGKTVAGLNMLRVAVKGTAGQKVLFKINDAIEQWVECTGYVQHLEFSFDLPLNPAKPLVIFANAGVGGESGVFEITELSYGNYSKCMDLLGKEWTQNEDGLHTVVSAANSLTISKAATEGTEWHAILLQLPEAKLSNYNVLQLTIKGTAGEKCLVKVNDQGAGEYWVACTGEEQKVVFPFNLEFDATKAALVLFANAGEVGTGHEFVITELLFKAEIKFEKPLIEKGDIDLMNQEWKPLDPTGYEVDKQAVISKVTTGGEWLFAAITLPEVEYKGVNKFLVTVKGTAGEEIMFKINDQGAGEKKVVCTGEVQELEFDLDFEFDAKKAACIIFCNPGLLGTGHEFVITKLALVGEEVEINLLNGNWRSLDEGVYPIEKQVIVTKDATGGEWACVAVTAPRYGFSNIIKLIATVKGTAGEEMMLKINDQGGALEKKIVCTGEAQTVEFELEHEFDPAKAALIIFANPGLFGTGHEFVITELTYVRKEVVVEVKDLDLTTGNWSSLDEGIYETSVDVVINKTVEGGEWACAAVNVEGADYTGVNKLVGKVKGTAGEEIMFKVNDLREYKVVCTGEVQEINFEFELEFNPDKHDLIIFGNPGKSGSGNNFEISELKLVGEDKSVDLLQGAWKSLDEGIYQIQKHISIHKVTTGTEWQCAKVDMGEVDYTGLKKLVVKVQGTAGEEIMFKVNDQNAGEKKVVCTGEVQELEFDLELEFDAAKPALIVFCNPGFVGTGNDFVIYSLLLTK